MTDEQLDQQTPVYPEHVPSVWDDLTDRAIQQTLAHGPGSYRRRNGAVFDFARTMLWHARWPEFTAADLEPYLSRWYQACRECLTNRDGSCLEYDEVLVMFWEIWTHHRATTPKGMDSWQNAILESQALVLPPLPPGVTPRLATLLKILWHYARQDPDRPVFITQGQAGLVVQGREGSDAAPDSGARFTGKAAIDYLVSLGLLSVHTPPKPHRPGRYLVRLPVAQPPEATPPTTAAGAMVDELNRIFDAPPMPEESAADAGEIHLPEI